MLKECHVVIHKLRLLLRTELIPSKLYFGASIYCTEHKLETTSGDKTSAVISGRASWTIVHHLPKKSYLHVYRGYARLELSTRHAA